MQLAADEREVLLAEIRQAVDQATNPRMRQAYQELLTAADASEIPDDLMPPLEPLLEVGLESGRIRRMHTAHGEMAAQRVYARTPAGLALRSQADAVNEALKALAGHTLLSLTVAA